MANRDQWMKDKVCMVTGATSGLGKVTAKVLAQNGATVIVVGRSLEKSTATVNQIKEETGNAEVEFMIADLSVQKDIRQLVQQFKSRHQRLDVLVNNAGAVFYKRQETIDGIEMTFAVNYLGHFLLTNLLLDTLKASAPARIINVSSGLHERAKIDFDDLQSKKSYSGTGAYGQAKLAVVLFTHELARRLEGTEVTVNAVNPGLVATKFGLEGSRVMGFMKRMVNVFGKSPEQGAQTTIYLATSPDVENVTSKYFENQKAVESSRASYDEAVARRLWQVSVELTGLKA
jgi:NAD(P)-dependent dehydrogenase (short-subunit alcohol dehydrogenase family)